MHGIPQGVATPPRPPRDGEGGLEPGGAEPDREAVEALERVRLGPAPGTVVLALVFLLTFAVYYFTNWKLLSFVWQIG